MSKKDKLLERFVYLRIEGHTFQEIAEELGTTKQTLINWNKDLQVKEQINSARQIRLQAIIKQYEQDRNSKITYHAELAKKLKKELLKRNLSNIKTDRLLTMILSNDKKIDEILPKIYFQDIKLDNDFFYFDPID